MIHYQTLMKKLKNNNNNTNTNNTNNNNNINININTNNNDDDLYYDQNHKSNTEQEYYNYLHNSAQKNRIDELNIKDLIFFDRDINSVYNYHNPDFRINCLFEKKNATFIYQKTFAHPMYEPLRFKYNILNKINEKYINIGFPLVLYPRKEEEVDNIIITDMNGDNLETIKIKLRNNGNKYNINDTIKIATEGITLIKTLHENGFLHCRITPSCFYYDSNIDIIRIDDFRWARSYQKNNTKYNIGNKFDHNIFPINKINTILLGKNTEKNICYSNDFTSTFNLRGEYFSRRDDLQSFGLVLIYLYTGNLPWTNYDGFETIKMKIKFVENDLFNSLCKNIPHQFKLYFEHVNSLLFEDEPDYKYLYNLFNNMLP